MAAASINALILSVVATAAITQFRAVNTAGAVPAAAATSLGFAAMGGAIGDAVPVVVLGTAIAEAGAAISVGALIEIDGSGRAITRSTGVSVGRALTAAAAAGDQVEVLLIPN